MTYNRIAKFDIVKGILIILVFFGHVIQGTQRETLVRYLIYSFHMPLFFGISGFLYNDKNNKLTILSIINKYINRLLIPWFIASIAYYVILYYNDSCFLSITNFINFYIDPYYHLWFSITLFIFILLHSVFNKLFFKRTNILLFISAIVFLLYILDVKSITQNYLFSTLKIYNCIYFEIGYWLKDKNIKINNTIILSLIGISFFFVFILFYCNDIYLEKVSSYILCYLLLIYICKKLVIKSNIITTLLEFLGINSYPIYLYHIICKDVAIKIGLELFDNLLVYYLLAILLFVVMCVFIKIVKKNKVLNKFVFGNI